MPGYGVANPGSLIGFVFLFVAIQLQHGQCAFPNSLLLFVQARGVFLGACTFIAACLISCLCPTRHLAQAFATALSFCCFVTSCHTARHAIHGLEKGRGWCGCGWLRGGAGQRLEVVVAGCLVCFACFAALFACLVCCFVLAFGCLCPCWVSLSCYNWHPVWFVFVPAGGNRFALGTGGIRWSLLVGGLGPVLSIPKLCFKPFRTN